MAETSRQASASSDGNGSGEVRVEQKPVLDGACDTCQHPPSMRPVGGMPQPRPHPRVTRGCRETRVHLHWASGQEETRRD
ncbi:hypothetical protein E2562_018328 [Oryza meyeriana var. granulata]|uniref:Uncharacterized protein n=1 Tax=Oryza meyeriana var. granulata TaxID=110450 RepID=A0A6G1CS65_9ORYZ|nr:hypothetical protein E2562_018328 [Oryza meyeriana var. granulata]